MRKWTAPVVFAAIVAVTVAAYVDSGVREAIQELYAEIRSLDTSAEPVHLDDVTWEKAKFVLDKLRQMINRDPSTTAAATGMNDRSFVEQATTATDGGAWWEPQRYYGKETPSAVDDDGTDRPIESVQKMMDRYAHHNSRRVPIVASSSPRCPPDVYADDLERKFRAAFRQYDTKEKKAAFRSTTFAIVSKPIHGNEYNKAKSPASQPARLNGRFSGFKIFNKKYMPSIAQ